ncbi:MAG TPA: NYN domain-containing protein [Candidatus Izemoplasmatales bacterium]|nr:NYN domain-containing protein [Candidatus Izemoplasmatales bacterium]
MENSNKKVAILIDAENVNSANARQIFDTMSTYGEVIIRQIFADWSNEAVKSWKTAISNYSIVSNQTFSFVPKKNTSDIAMVIQAMNILYEREVDIFCLVSSDSDFTRLVQELRERGKTVIGMGGRTSIKSFVYAFSEFIYLGEDITENGHAKTEDTPIVKAPETKPLEIKKPEPAPVSAPVKPKANEFIPLEEERMDAIREIIETLIDEYGKAYYSQIGTDMKNKFSDFVPKNYHCKSLKFLIDNILQDLPEFEKGKTTQGNTKGAEVLYLIRKKEKKVPNAKS